MARISSEHNKQMERETQEHNKNKRATIKKMERGRGSKRRHDRHDMKATGLLTKRTCGHDELDEYKTMKTSALLAKPTLTIDVMTVA